MFSKKSNVNTKIKKVKTKQNQSLFQASSNANEQKSVPELICKVINMILFVN